MNAGIGEDEALAILGGFKSFRISNKFMRNFSISIKTGKMPDQNVDCGINSANTILFAMGSGTAADYRDAGGTLPSDDEGYWNIVSKVEKENPVIGTVLSYVNRIRPAVYKAQKVRLESIAMNGSQEFALSEAVLFPSFDLAEKLGKAKYVIDAINMTYNWKEQPNPSLIPPTFNTIMDSLYSSLILAADVNSRSVAIPLIGRRKGPKLSKEESRLPTKAALSKFDTSKTSVEEAYIVIPEELKEEVDWHRKFYDA